MENTFEQRLKDYFEPCELVELLDGDITMDELLYAFREVIEENEDMLQEYMDHGR